MQPNRSLQVEKWMPNVIIGDVRVLGLHLLSVFSSNRVRGCCSVLLVVVLSRCGGRVRY